MSAGDLSVARVLPPVSVGAWTVTGGVRRIEPAGIFDYMDGGGELYLAYRLRHIDVYEYATQAAGEDAILVEIYSVKTPDDAYGLLSQDWGGESLQLAGDWPADQKRALYGAGLLRIWTADVFVRVMASLETPASREAVLTIGRAVVAGRALAAPPALLGAVPREVGDYRARLDRQVYLRSHLVLNSLYFLATANVLELGPDVEAVAVPYDGARAAASARVQLVLVRYASNDAACRALAHFRSAYLPQLENAKGDAARMLVKIEDGWAGWRMTARALVLVFGAPEAQTGSALLDAVSARVLDAGSPPS